MTPGKARMIVKSFLEEGDPLFEYLLGAMEENDLIPQVMDFPRFNLERRVVTEKCGRIDPEDIYDYIAEGGYASLVKALQLPARGDHRGGAGFGSAGKRGRRVSHRHQVGPCLGGTKPTGKTVICNADEGDPGAYMDRTILESNPHQVLEGLAICAYAVGAGEGIVYVRAEYPLAVRLVQQGHPARQRSWVSWAGTSWGAASISTWTCSRAPGPLSAGRRRP